jgi:hypothetical protein
MKCLRCGGLMVLDVVYDDIPDLYEGSDGLEVFRCVHCGDILDEVIFAHRRSPKPPPPIKSSRPRK